ncbi:MAG TPA: winged helix-turn-helix domain-containing protein [Pyrinomonadaceae bacterium]|nr:winged helix-turn-helix domain-containing protein [Pyrinomonadaceae bacterium]
MVKPPVHRIYEFESFRFDVAHLMLYRGEVEISLAPKAAQTLLTLIERRGEILSKDELMENIWNDSIVEEANLTQYVHVLRKTLGKSADGKPLIETLRRRGYRFNGDVRCLESQTNGNSAPFASKTQTADKPETNRRLSLSPLYLFSPFPLF